MLKTSLKTSSKYKSYLDSRHVEASVTGGDTSKSDALDGFSYDKQKFNKWKGSINDSNASDPISFIVKSIRDIILYCKDLDDEERTKTGLIEQ